MDGDGWRSPLRGGLLDATTVVVAGPPGAAAGPYGSAASEECAALGATVLRVEVLAAGGGEGAEGELRPDVGELLAGPRPDVVVVDAAAMFASAGEGRSALVRSLDGAWTATRGLATGAFIDAGRPGRVVLVGPAEDSGEHATGALAGVENLARTLSIEWARHGITAVAIAPARSGERELGALVAYLASPAGGYFSGCLLDLRGPGARGPGAGGTTRSSPRRDRR